MGRCFVLPVQLFKLASPKCRVAQPMRAANRLRLKGPQGEQFSRMVSWWHCSDALSPRRLTICDPHDGARRGCRVGAEHTRESIRQTGVQQHDVWSNRRGHAQTAGGRTGEAGYRASTPHIIDESLGEFRIWSSNQHQWSCAFDRHQLVRRSSTVSTGPGLAEAARRLNAGRTTSGISRLWGQPTRSASATFGAT